MEICGHVAQRLEHGAYTSAVLGSSPSMPTAVLLFVYECDSVMMNYDRIKETN